MSASYFYVRLSAQALRRVVSDARRGKLRFEPFACAKGKCAPLPFLFAKKYCIFLRELRRIEINTPALFIAIVPYGKIKCDGKVSIKE